MVKIERSTQGRTSPWLSSTISAAIVGLKAGQRLALVSAAAQPAAEPSVFSEERLRAERRMAGVEVPDGEAPGCRAEEAEAMAE